MKGAKELADFLRNDLIPYLGQFYGSAHLPDIAAHLDRLAAIDSAVTGEVGEIQQRADEAHLWDGCPPERCDEAEKDRADLLMIVHRQEGVIADLRRRPAESRALRAEIERDSARAEVERLTERLRTMQHGEAEALKMMEAEKKRADRLAAEVDRYSQRELAYTHIDPPAEKLPAPLACPNCDRRDTWCEFLGDSGLMRCEKHSGGCGYSMSLDANEPENLRQARDLLRQEKTEANATILRLRAEATAQRERADRAEARLAESVVPVVDMTPGMQPRQPSKDFGELPAWVRELERLAHWPPDGPKMLSEQFQMLGSLVELDNLRRVILSGRGEAVIPEGVARVAWPRHSPLGKRVSWDDAELMVSYPPTGNACGNDPVTAREILAAIDSYANSLINP